MKKLILFISILTISNSAFALTTIPLETELLTTTQLTSFTDVTDDNTFHNGITLLLEKKIINGYKDGTYRPERSISRAEMLKIVIESAVKSNVISPDIESFDGKSCFTDVHIEQWYNKYICYAKNEGLIVGYKDGTVFEPNKDVSFVEGLKMAMGIFNYEFTEDGEIWYEDMVNKASQQQLIPNTINSFKNPIDRGEMSDMSGRIISKYENNLDLYLGDNVTVSHTFESIKNSLEAPIFTPQSSYDQDRQVLPNKDEIEETEDSINEDSLNDEQTPEGDVLFDGEVDDASKTTTDTVVQSIKKWAIFNSLPFEFSCEYPELWYYFGASTDEDDNIIRHYGFSSMSTTNDDGSENENYTDLVSIDILASQDEIAGTLIATAGKELTMSQIDGVFTVYMIVNDKPFRVSGDAVYKNIILTMAKSIEHTEHEDDLENDNEEQNTTDGSSPDDTNTSDGTDNTQSV